MKKLYDWAEKQSLLKIFLWLWLPLLFGFIVISQFTEEFEVIHSKPVFFVAFIFGQIGTSIGLLALAAIIAGVFKLFKKDFKITFFFTGLLIVVLTYIGALISFIEKI